MKLITPPRTNPAKKRYLRTGVHLLCALGALILNTPHSVYAEAIADNSPWEITADRILRLTGPACIVAQGQVVLTQKPQFDQTLEAIETSADKKEQVTVDGPTPVVIKGDWVRFDSVNNIVKARGNVSLVSEDEQIQADSVTLDLTDHTGTLHNATLFFPKRKLFLAGNEVKKTGDLSYEFKSGWVTKCAPEEGKAPPWSFAWKEAKLTQGGFAHFKDATFKVRDQPLVYTPYFAFSTNRDRKTGLLLPEISYSGRDGAGLLAPLFLNLSPSHDMTLYAGYLSARGPQMGAEYRYTLDYESRGTFAINYLNDDLDDRSDDYKSDGIYRTEKNRYWIRGKVDHDFGNDLRAKLDMDLVSDRDFLQEFQDGTTGFEESDKQFRDMFSRGFEQETTVTRSNTLLLSKMWSDMSLNAELRAIQDPTETPSDSHLWSLPKVSFSGQQPVFENQSLPDNSLVNQFRDLDLLWDSEYVNYWRDNEVSAQRADLHPTLVTPLRISPYLETTASAGIRETLYLVEDNSPVSQGYDSDLMSRTVQDYNITTSSIFMRDFSTTLLGYNTLTHMLRPQLSYDYIPTTPQEKFPNLDAVDRIDRKNLITYKLLNNFDLSSAKDNSAWQYGHFNITQSYNIAEEKRLITNSIDKQKPFSAVSLDMGILPTKGLSVTYKTDIDMYGDGVTKHEIQSKLFNKNGDNLGLEYRYEMQNAINQFNANVRTTLSEKISLTGDLQHSFETDKTTEASIGLLYDPECWSVEFMVSSTPDDDYRFAVIFALEGIGKVFGLDQSFSSSK